MTVTYSNSKYIKNDGHLVFKVQIKNYVFPKTLEKKYIITILQKSSIVLS